MGFLREITIKWHLITIINDHLHTIFCIPYFCLRSLDYDQNVGYQNYLLSVPNVILKFHQLRSSSFTKMTSSTSDTPTTLSLSVRIVSGFVHSETMLHYMREINSQMEKKNYLKKTVKLRADSRL